MVGLNIGIEISKAANMVNVKAAPDVFLGAPAILADISVTSSRCSFLCPPVGAIIAFIATTPGGIARTASAHTGTFRRAEAALTARAHFTLRDRHFFTTRFASEDGWGFSEGAGAFLGSLAPSFPPFFRDIVGFGHFSLDNAEGAPTVQAFTRAYRRIFGIAQSAWICLKCLSANWAGKLYHAPIITQFGFMGKKGGICCA